MTRQSFGLAGQMLGEPSVVDLDMAVYVVIERPYLDL